MRALLYWLAQVLGDISAVSSGRTGKRLSRRVRGRAVSRWLR